MTMYSSLSGVKFLLATGGLSRSRFSSNHFWKLNGLSTDMICLLWDLQVSAKLSTFKIAGKASLSSLHSDPNDDYSQLYKWRIYGAG